MLVENLIATTILNFQSMVAAAQTRVNIPAPANVAVQLQVINDQLQANNRYAAMGMRSRLAVKPHHIPAPSLVVPAVVPPVGVLPPNFNNNIDKISWT